MKIRMIFLSVAVCSSLFFANAQSTRNKCNLTVKEWKTPAGSKTRYMDEMTKYNAKGQKIEQIEYDNYAQKSRTTYEYDSKGNCVKQVVYDAKNKVMRIRKFEYYPDGSKKKQYNYAPSGKLLSTREFEYIFE